MKWVTWDQAAACALCCGIVLVALRRRRPTRFTEALLPWVKELGFVSAIYSLWRVARELPLANDEGAIERGRRIAAFQDWLHLPSEVMFQGWVIGRGWLEWFSTGYYAIVHVPATIAFMVWMFMRHRDAYPRWRTGLALVTAACLIIRFERVAPPRFLADLGFVGLSRGRLDVYGPVGTGVSDQFAAMPSIHVAWAAVVSFGIVAVLKSRWRWLAMLHLVFTVWAVTVTGHHWWLDGIVAVLLLWLALAVDSRLRTPAPALGESASPTRACATSALRRARATVD